MPLPQNLASKIPFLSAGIVVVMVLLTSGCATIIEPGSRGMKVTLGQLSPRLLGEGLHWKTPFLDTIMVQSIKQQTEYQKTQCYSKDLQTMAVDYAVLYRLPESKLLKLYAEYSGDVFRNLVIPIIEDNLKSTASNYTAQEFVNQRDKVKAQMMAQVQEDLNGTVEIVDVPIKNVELSQELENAIERKQVQEQEAQAERYRLQKAELEAKRKIVEATAEAEAIRVKAVALGNNPKIVELEQLKVEQDRIQKWNGQSPQTVILGTGSNTSVLLPAR